MAPAACAAEDGLVGYQWEERSFCHMKAVCLSVGECQAQKAEVVRGGGGGDGEGFFQRRNQERG
jgi:hypothetical protein